MPLKKFQHTSRRSPPKSLALNSKFNCCKRLYYYSSQPETLDQLADNLKISFKRSHSLNDLDESLAEPLAKILAYSNANKLQQSAVTHRQPQAYPILQICPSTPTPSDGDTPVLQSPSHSVSYSTNKANKLKYQSNNAHAPSSALNIVSNSNYKSKNININNKNNKYMLLETPSPPENINSNSLLKPPSPLSLSPCSHTMSLSSLHCRRSTSPFHDRSHHRHRNHQQHHRSLSELNASIGSNNISGSSISDSPSMKRFASPASAAIAAAAAATGSLFGGSRSKLSPSPIKTAPIATSNAAIAAAQQQAESVSSNTTTSTATTIIPKEMSSGGSGGEMCRRSSDSDLSVTPKGMF